MKKGRASETAVMVCVGRALAHGRGWVPKFDDPIALELLPDEARAQVERMRAGRPATDAKSRFLDATAERRAKMMAVRTVVIDEAVRAAKHSQVVILGAGLDARAWRMSELKDATVFEVDHPDSQRPKQERVARFPPQAGTVRFVPVDFTQDKLGDALAGAGHDATRPTTWIWEGVVMYLTPAEVEATLAVIAERSPPGSRLALVYFRPALILFLVGFLVRRVGEPLRSSYSPQAMRALLAKHGFDVLDDDDLPALGRKLAPVVEQELRPIRHGRVAVADRRAT